MAVRGLHDALLAVGTSPTICPYPMQNSAQEGGTHSVTLCKTRYFGLAPEMHSAMLCSACMKETSKTLSQGPQQETTNCSSMDAMKFCTRFGSVLIEAIEQPRFGDILGEKT